MRCTYLEESELTMIDQNRRLDIYDLHETEPCRARKFFDLSEFYL